MCPPECENRKLTMDPQTGCQRCECDCWDGPPPCPQDCGVEYHYDVFTGCINCRCDPNDTYNPLIPQIPCMPLDSNGEPPCPADCNKTQKWKNPRSSCLECICKPVKTNKNCEIDPNTSRPPCPSGCDVHYPTDPLTGCTICQCRP